MKYFETADTDADTEIINFETGDTDADTDIAKCVSTDLCIWYWTSSNIFPDKKLDPHILGFECAKLNLSVERKG